MTKNLDIFYKFFVFDIDVHFLFFLNLYDNALVKILDYNILSYFMFKKNTDLIL